MRVEPVVRRTPPGGWPSAVHADILYLVSKRLPYHDKLKLLGVARAWSDNIYWSCQEQTRRIVSAFKHNASDAFILMLLRTPIPVTDDRYLGLLSLSCLRGKWEVVKVLVADTRFTAIARGKALEAACLASHVEVIEAILEGNDIDFEVAFTERERLYSRLNVLGLLMGDSRRRPYFKWAIIMQNAMRNGLNRVFDHLLQMARSEPSADHDVAGVLAFAFSQCNTRVIKAIIGALDVGRSGTDKGAIYDASGVVDADLVKQLLVDLRVGPFAKEYQADPNTTFAATFAVVSHCHNFLAVRALLLDPRVDPSAADNQAVRFASGCGDVGLVKQLLNDPRVDPAAKEDQGKSALHEACRNNQADVIKLLLQDPRVDPASKNNEVLLVASQRGYCSAVKAILLDPRVDPSAANNQAIRFASGCGHVDLVKQLLEDPRVDPTAMEDQGNAALHEACRNNKVDVIKLLLQDPRVDPASNNNEALAAASQNPSCLAAVTTLLLDQRVNPSGNVIQGRIDPSAECNKGFCDAYESGSEDVALRLLRNRYVDPAANDNRAVQEGSAKGLIKLLKALLKDPRVDPSANDNYAIRAARRSGSKRIVALLLADKRVNPDSPSFTPNG
ncbi:ankyrin repeat-containing domain protein [Geranomyces variabilis]|nr:ankyrin repeat-containing domain protein [Geranomyces variabilis]KAJ3142321.1 hypothetical protein HDU90_004594 [Geranomyces variabilis]